MVLFSKNSAKLISKLSKYLALNAHINSSNVGYHTLKNYKNINCLIINAKKLDMSLEIDQAK